MLAVPNSASPNAFVPGVARTYVLTATPSSFVILLAHREKLYVRQIPTIQLLVATEANTHKAADCLDLETIAACCFAVRAVLRSHKALMHLLC